ncbi:MAG TPA: DUF503 domain-containing protein [Candidatus Polarisedimenticolia bacterium]|nr:DUF503 domain-containing protein [Candidatus Polarisedimenticolia bacterium]
MGGASDGPSIHVGLCVVQLHLPAVTSLKGKRQILRSLKDRLRENHNVAVAEVEHQDLWQRATIGIVGIASAHVRLEQTFESIQDEIERRVPGELVAFEVEYLS